ncbi:MAG TPA: 1,4-dihydroxy-2-naphthoate polyprenyltransferase [Clostridiales bacterium]|jgi:1,4-dihydroxy-2-naphthoate octaprenyltransferase|nr:1,4-dihydroxy-2-naphthoate polyprenyltransferase [Clostridiales bacterium]
MNFKSFLKLVEIQTKAASIVPFLLGTFYALYTYAEFSFLNFLIMLISLEMFDMATTTINNYIDFKSAKKKEGYGYESHNAIVRDNIPEKLVQLTIGALLSIAIIFGIILVMRTNLLVLIIGIMSFTAGILYTFGPVPISRTPFGELVSGFVMGFFIIFLSTYIHVYENSIVIFNLNNWIIDLSIDLVDLLKIFLVSLPAQLGIANLMLANNICDIEDDVANDRYTLPRYIGKENSIRLYSLMYIKAFVVMIILIVFDIVPLITLLALLTFIPVMSNIHKFRKEQSKDRTFELAVHNFLIMNVALALSLLIGVIF